MPATERRQMSVDMDTIRQADRCAARLTLRLGEKITRIGAVRIALAELEDKLDEFYAQRAQQGGDGRG